MVLYHLHRGSNCDSERTFELLSNEQLSPELRSSKLVQLLENRLSWHGVNHLSPTTTLHPYQYSHGKVHAELCTVFSQLQSADHRILEYGLELVRQTHFPQNPSRLQCIFAVKSIDDFNLWPELTDSSNYPIYKIEVPDDTPYFDAGWLKGGLSRDFLPNGYHISYAPTLCFDLAYNYWSGIPTNAPRWEYLVQLPVSGIKIQT